MQERVVLVTHSTINCWVMKCSPYLEAALNRRKRPVWSSWRTDATHIRVKGEWRYVYCAWDKYCRRLISCLQSSGIKRLRCSP
jgi:transposase-like protein